MLFLVIRVSYETIVIFKPIKTKSCKINQTDSKIKDGEMNKLYQAFKKCDNYFVVISICLIFVYGSFFLLNDNTLMHNHWKHVNMVVGILIFINYCVYRHINKKEQLKKHTNIEE